MFIKMKKYRLNFYDTYNTYHQLSKKQSDEKNYALMTKMTFSSNKQKLITSTYPNRTKQKRRYDKT